MLESFDIFSFEFIHIFNLACRKTAKMFVWVDVKNMLNKIAEIYPGRQDDGVRDIIAVLEWFREYIDYGLMSFQKQDEHWPKSSSTSCP